MNSLKILLSIGRVKIARTNHLWVKRNIRLELMQEIIPFLYLGDKKDAENKELLSCLCIKAIVNCCTYMEFPASSYHPGFEYFRVDIEDTSREPVHLFFEDVAKFIDSFVKRQLNVLVHCKSGVSRSVTITISYLLTRRLFSLQKAFFHVLSKRNIICPNIGFMEQLGQYEETLLRESTVCMYKYTDWYCAESSARPSIPDLDP